MCQCPKDFGRHRFGVDIRCPVLHHELFFFLHLSLPRVEELIQISLCHSLSSLSESWVSWIAIYPVRVRKSWVLTRLFGLLGTFGIWGIGIEGC